MLCTSTKIIIARAFFFRSILLKVYTETVLFLYSAPILSCDLRMMLHNKLRGTYSMFFVYESMFHTITINFALQNQNISITLISHAIIALIVSDIGIALNKTPCAIILQLVNRACQEVFIWQFYRKLNRNHKSLSIFHNYSELY